MRLWYQIKLYNSIHNHNVGSDRFLKGLHARPRFNIGWYIITFRHQKTQMAQETQIVQCYQKRTVIDIIVIKEIKFLQSTIQSYLKYHTTLFKLPQRPLQMVYLTWILFSATTTPVKAWRRHRRANFCKSPWRRSKRDILKKNMF